MTNTTQSKQPTHRLYVVKGEGDAARWTEIGAAWPNKDGSGFSISLDAAPIGGRLVMREAKRETETEAQQ